MQRLTFEEFRKAIVFAESRGAVTKPCIYAALWYHYLKDRIKIEKFVSDISYDIPLPLACRYQGHHFGGHLGYTIASELVLRRGAKLELVTMDEWECNLPGVPGRYDGISKPCPDYPCDRGGYWRDCLNCPEREGSLPIYIEVGTITTPMKLLNPIPYEVWVCRSKLGKCYCYSIKVDDEELVDILNSTIINTIISTDRGCILSNYLGLGCVCRVPKIHDDVNPSLIDEILWIMGKDLIEWGRELRNELKYYLKRVSNPYDVRLA